MDHLNPIALFKLLTCGKNRSFEARRSHDKVPDDKYLFSELPHYPRCTIQAGFIWVRHRYVVFVVWRLRLFFIPKVNEWMFWQSELINKLGDRCIMRRHSAAVVKSLCHFKLPVDLQKVLRAKPPKFKSDRLLNNPVDSLFSRVGAAPIWLVKTKHIEKIEHWRQVRWQEIVHSNLSAHFILQPLVCLSFAAKALPWPAWPAWLTAGKSAKGHLASRMLESSGVCINQ